jgi:hypothetical protein
MKFEGYYLILSNNKYNDGYHNIDIINFNEKFILSYFNNNVYYLYSNHDNQFEHQFYYFYDFEINNKKITFKTDYDFKHSYNIKDMYAIKNKHFFLIKKNPPKDLSLESIRNYFIKCGLEELAI